MLSHASDRRAAIVCTLGPASDTPDRVEAMVRAGMDVVRLSMGNGSREWHAATADLVRDVAATVGRPVRLMADLQARKNRLGALPGGRAKWSTGEEVVLHSTPGEFASHRTWTTYSWRPHLVPVGGSVLIDDGAVVLTVVDVDDASMRCVVTGGGTVTAGRGVSVPGSTNVERGLVQRDIDDLHFACELGVDIVALSFACSADDYLELRACGADQILIGKVEHPEALAALPSLVTAFDGLMVARGDLAVETPYAEVPLVQKRIVAACASRRKISMVATQFLHSMRESALPTRAEVSDVANTVLDGADALMVTGETGYGRHPVRVVEVLHEVIVAAERSLSGVRPAPDRAPSSERGAIMNGATGAR